MRLRRFKGMIYPGLGASFEGPLRVRGRKSIWMVEYLRARRLAAEPCNTPARREIEQRMAAYFRREHFRHKKRILA